MSGSNFIRIASHAPAGPHFRHSSSDELSSAVRFLSPLTLVPFSGMAPPDLIALARLRGAEGAAVEERIKRCVGGIGDGEWRLQWNRGLRCEVRMGDKGSSARDWGWRMAC